MAQTRQHPRLPREPRLTPRVTGKVSHHLDRDRPAQHSILSAMDVRHPAPTDDLAKDIAVPHHRGLPHSNSSLDPTTTVWRPGAATPGSVFGRKGANANHLDQPVKLHQIGPVVNARAARATSVMDPLSPIVA